MNDRDPSPEGHSRQTTEAGLHAPDRLIQALRQSQNQRVFVPKHVDDAILAAARSHLSAIPRSEHDWRPIAWWSAVAASLALVAGWWFKGGQVQQELALEHERVPGDFNGDQQVDVLDALILAQHVEQGADGGLQDMNGDHVIDQKDAEWIARQAVRLPKGGRS